MLKFKTNNRMPAVNHMLRDSFGNVIAKNGESHMIRGKLKGVGSDGSIINTQNCTVYNGRRYLLESILKQSPVPSQKLTLNTILNINADSDSRTNADEYNKRKVCLVGFGIGGATDTFGNVYDATINDNNLFNLIPIRVVPVSADLTAAEQKNYALKRQETINGSNYYCYYLKVVTPDTITVQLQDANYTPSTEDNNPEKTESDILSTENIQIFSEIPISVETTDIKDWFTYTYGNLNNARFNEIALFEGYYDASVGDYVHVECFSHLTMNNRPMDTDGAKYDFNYFLIS